MKSLVLSKYSGKHLFAFEKEVGYIREEDGWIFLVGKRNLGSGVAVVGGQGRQPAGGKY